MKTRSSWLVQGALLFGALSFVGAKGCVFDGDASLGSDGSAGEDTGGSSSEGGSSSSAGKPTNVGGAVAVAGTGMGGSVPVAGTGMGGSVPVAGTSAGGAGPEPCDLPIDPGPCDAAIPTWAYDSAASKCVQFTFGGCEGNENRFTTREACEASCVNLSCPSHLQTDTVYFVQPLNRPERACIVLDKPVHVSCSMLLNPSLTVPTDFQANHCVVRDGTAFYAGTTLPKAEGWADCSPGEAEIVNEAVDCAAL